MSHKGKERAQWVGEPVMVLEGGTLGSLDTDLLQGMGGMRRARLSVNSPLSPPEEPFGGGSEAGQPGESSTTSWAFIPRRPSNSPAKKMMQSSPLSPTLPSLSSSLRPKSPRASGSQSASARNKPLPPPILPPSATSHPRHGSSSSSSPTDIISPSSAHFVPRRKVRCDSISTPSFSATFDSSYLPLTTRTVGSPTASSSRLPPPLGDHKTAISGQIPETSESALLPHYSLDAKFSLPPCSEPLDLESLIGGLENLGPSLKRSLGEAMSYSKKPTSASSKAADGDGQARSRPSEGEDAETGSGKGTGRKVSLGLGLFKESSTSQKEKERREKDKDRARGGPAGEGGEDEPAVRSRSRGLTLLDIVEGHSPPARKTSLPSTSPQDSGLPPSPKSPHRHVPQRRPSHRSRRPTLVATPKLASFSDAVVVVPPSSTSSLTSPRLPTSPLASTRPSLSGASTGLSESTFVPVGSDGTSAANSLDFPSTLFLSSRPGSPSASATGSFGQAMQVASSSEEDDWTDSYGSSPFESEDDSDASSGGLVSSYIGGHGLGTPPRDHFGVTPEHGASGDEHDDDWDDEDESHLPTIPLMPFRNQVGGHSAIYKFTKRAVCKVSRPHFLLACRSGSDCLDIPS